MAKGKHAEPEPREDGEPEPREDGEPEPRGEPPDPFKASELLAALDTGSPGSVGPLCEWMEANEHPWAAGAKWLADSRLWPRVDPVGDARHYPETVEPPPHVFIWPARYGRTLPGPVATRLNKLDWQARHGHGLGVHILDVCRAATEALAAGERL